MVCGSKAAARSRGVQAPAVRALGGAGEAGTGAGVTKKVKEVGRVGGEEGALDGVGFEFRRCFV